MHYDVASIVDSQSKTSLDVINLIVDTARDIRINECYPLLISPESGLQCNESLSARHGR